MNEAARVILAGGVVAYPTEAVYGFGCAPLAADAIERILNIKRRGQDKGLIVVAANFDQLEPFVSMPKGPRRAEIESSWPGPVTWVLPAKNGVPVWLTGGRGTLAVRVTAHPIAQYLCQRAGQAIVSTSANRSGKAPAISALGVRRMFRRDVDYFLAGPVGPSSRPTVIRDGLTGAVIRAG